MIFRGFYTILFSLLSVVVFPNNEKLINQIKEKINSTQHDSLRIKDFIQLSGLLFESNFQESINYNNQAIGLARQIKRYDLQINAMNAFADRFWYSARYDLAFDYYYKAYKLADSINDKVQIANSLYNIGWLSCIDQKNYGDISYLHRSLKLSKDLNKASLTLKVSNALGFLFVTKYQEKRLKTDFDSAIYYLQSCKELAIKIKHYTILKALNVNFGDLFFISKDYASAKFYYQKGLDRADTSARAESLGLLLFKISSCNYALDPIKRNLDSLKRGFERIQQRDQKSDILEASKMTANILYDTERYKEAVFYNSIFLATKAELDKITYASSLSSKEIATNLEKANAKMVALQQANEIEALNNKRKTTYLVILVVFSFVIAFIVFLLFKQNKLKQNSNQKLEAQNKIISEKKSEIEQSIVYAKGIQTSFLPEKDLLDIFLPSNFIFYQPKDIVSGDFYWFETSKDKKQILIACADSTGHGVPGALMSMVGINFLQRNGGAERLNSPAVILRNLNNAVKDAFKQNDVQNKQRDGMDLALVLIDFTTNKLVFAGANRPLYIIRNNRLIEFKSTKRSIGGYTEYDRLFPEEEFQLLTNDMLVLSTDGYADQFGGNDGKKLMTRKLKEYLVQISNLKCEEQLLRIQSAFNDWKGTNEQVDDVCLIGINYK